MRAQRPGTGFQARLRILRAGVALIGFFACAVNAYAFTEQARGSRDQARILVAALTQTQTEPAGAISAPSQSAITPKKPRPGISRIARRAPDTAAAPTAAQARTSSPVITVTGTGPGQAGYVHYFVIKAPDGAEETQIGIELPDRRIAWSFPGLGVVVTPFIVADAVAANGKFYEVRHLYGFRPFPDDASMRVLQSELPARVLPWVEDATPYCNTQVQPDYFCVSCLGFTLRILYPGPTPAYPELPRDFGRASPNSYYTTEDLLLYLVGMDGLRGKEARLKRVEELTLPGSLREEVIRLVNAAVPHDTVAAAEVIAPAIPAAKNRAGTRPASKNPQQRLPQRKGAS